MADLAQRRLRSKIPALTEALTGRFSDHHGFLARVHLDLIDRHSAAMAEITERIEVVIEPFRGFRDLIATIPGVGQSWPTSSPPRPVPTCPGSPAPDTSPPGPGPHRGTTSPPVT